MNDSSNPAPAQPTDLLNDFIPDEANLSAEAKQIFPYHTSILRVFQLHRAIALKNVHMTPVGRHLLFSEMADLFHTGHSVLNYIAANRGILESPRIDRPIIITGLPRTGSTLLFNLLACDPNSRAPHLTDVLVKCVPPIPRSDVTGSKERLLELKSMFEEKQKILGRKLSLAASHPVYRTEEDYYILRHVGFSLLFFLHSFDHPSESEKWLFDENDKEFIYEYHEIFFRMLNSVDAPRSHWIFKAPFHSLFLDTFLKHYPGAKLIMTHRRLEEVIPSFCRLFWAGLNIYSDENDVEFRKVVYGFASRFLEKLIERILKFRQHSSSSASKDVLDVAYHDLMERPIEVVRQIYQHFGLEYSNEFEVAMQQWLDHNPQGKQGRHTYDLSDVNLTSQDIQQRYADYLDRFRSFLSAKMID